MTRAELEPLARSALSPMNEAMARFAKPLDGQMKFLGVSLVVVPLYALMLTAASFTCLRLDHPSPAHSLIEGFPSNRFVAVREAVSSHVNGPVPLGLLLPSMAIPMIGCSPYRSSVGAIPAAPQLRVCAEFHPSDFGVFVRHSRIVSRNDTSYKT